MMKRAAQPGSEPGSRPEAAANASRRHILKSGLGALGATALTALAASGCDPSRDEPSLAPARERARMPRFMPTLFSVEQALLVEDLAERILPETQTPGAARAEVPAFVESMVRDVYEDGERLAFLAGLDELNAEARQRHAQPFFHCDKAQQAALLTERISREPAVSESDTDPPWSFLRAFRELCIEGFCQSRLGATQVMQYESVPGEYRGCVPLESVGKAWATS